jgi:propanol-preferring alcohol dehydrogenase
LFGFGGLGQLALRIALHQGLRVAVVDSSADRVAAPRAAGATAEAGGVDAVIVLTADTAAIPDAFRALRRNGRLILVGLSTSSYDHAPRAHSSHRRHRRCWSKCAVVNSPDGL